ncbi:MAG: hypothetical protein KGR26_16850 [Cyanobacteria bacterium REEB65]|nr:hypothetical protein [Cyanobacteria bacterium REEB65]
MARWKLMTSHYLNTVRPAIWRYREVSGGEARESEYIVPRMLDINDPKCWTNRAEVGLPVNRGGNMSDAEGEVIVCQPGKGLPGDIEFIGDPTPDMLPQDEEATEISAGFQALWAYKPDGVEIPYSQSIVDRHGEAERPATVQIDGMSELVQALEAQSRMMSAIVENLSPATTPARRI